MGNNGTFAGSDANAPIQAVETQHSDDPSLTADGVGGQYPSLDRLSGHEADVALDAGDEHYTVSVIAADKDVLPVSNMYGDADDGGRLDLATGEKF